jgi:hypothetical protein
MRAGLSLTIGLAAIALLGMTTVPTFAHHSTAEFDYTKRVVSVGKVEEVQWTNPHSYLQVLVPTEDGKSLDWAARTSMRRWRWIPIATSWPRGSRWSATDWTASRSTSTI